MYKSYYNEVSDMVDAMIKEVGYAGAVGRMQVMLGGLLTRIKIYESEERAEAEFKGLLHVSGLNDHGVTRE